MMKPNYPAIKSTYSRVFGIKYTAIVPIASHKMRKTQNYLNFFVQYFRVGKKWKIKIPGKQFFDEKYCFLRQNLCKISIE